MHRRITKSPGKLTIAETGSGRIVAFVPIDEVFELQHPAIRTATQIKLLPNLIDYIRARASEGDQQAVELLKGTA